MPNVTFQVKQHKEMTEVFLGWETENKYTIYDDKLRTLAEAREVSSWLGRMFLRGGRAFEMDVWDRNGDYLMFLKKEFAFFFPRLVVRDGRQRYMGAIQSQFSLFERHYIVEDAMHRTLFQIIGPFWWPWTFYIMENGVQRGEIRKRWSGFFTEAFTDADNFTVTCPAEWEGPRKLLLMAATLLIDFVHFEN